MLSSKISASGKIALLLNYNSPSVIAELSLLTVYFSRHRSELEFSRSKFTGRTDWSCVSVRFNTAEAINECDLKPAKRKQGRFIGVERLSNITINFVNLWSGSIPYSPSESLLLRDLARALRARTLTKWVRFWIWALLQNNRAEKLGNLIKVKATLTLSKMPPQGD